MLKSNALIHCPEQRWNTLPNILPNNCIKSSLYQMTMQTWQPSASILKGASVIHQLSSPRSVVRVLSTRRVGIYVFYTYIYKRRLEAWNTSENHFAILMARLTMITMINLSKFHQTSDFIFYRTIMSPK